MSTTKRGYTRAFGSSQGGAAPKKKKGTYKAPTKKKHILGTTTRATLRYSANVTVTSASVFEAVGTHVFSANGAYDPDITGAGSQPRGFDELMALYDHYTVTASRVKVRYTNNSTTRPYVAIAVRDSPTGVPDAKTLFESSDCKITDKILGRLSEGNESCAMTHNVNVGNFLGRKSVMSDSELKGSAAANPAEQVYYHINCVNMDGSASSSVDAIVTLEYDIVLHEPKTPLAS